MKKLIVPLMALLVVAGLAACEPKYEKTTPPNNFGLEKRTIDFFYGGTPKNCKVTGNRRTAARPTDYKIEYQGYCDTSWGRRFFSSGYNPTRGNEVYVAPKANTNTESYCIYKGTSLYRCAPRDF